MEVRQLKPKVKLHSSFLSKLRKQLQVILQDDKTQGRYTDIQPKDAISDIMLAKMLWNLLESVEEVYADPNPAFDQFWKPLKLNKLRETYLKALANTSVYQELMITIRTLFEKADCAVFLEKSKDMNQLDLIQSDVMLTFMGDNHQHLTLNTLIYLFDISHEAANFIRANHQGLIEPILEKIEVITILKPAYEIFKSILMKHLRKAEEVSDFLDKMNFIIFDLLHVRDSLINLKKEWDYSRSCSEVSVLPRQLASNFWHIFCSQIVSEPSSCRAFYHRLVFSVGYVRNLDFLLDLVNELKSDSDENIFYIKRSLTFLEAELLDGSNNRRSLIMLGIQDMLKTILAKAETKEVKLSSLRPSC